MGYADRLGTTEVSRQTKEVCDELERQGWTCINVIQGRGARFICPQSDDCKHSGLWVSLTLITPQFLESAFARTCLTRFTLSQ